MVDSMVRTGVAAAVLMLATAVWGADAPAPEILPPPTPLNPPVPLMPGPVIYRPLYVPPLSRDIWSLYEVDHRGRWMPRVIVSPYGNYYQYNHATYPWAAEHPEYYRPKLVN
jgi:hypothetical protein